MKKTSNFIPLLWVFLLGLGLSACGDGGGLFPPDCLDFKDLPQETDGYRYVENRSHTNGFSISSVDFNPNNKDEFIAALVDADNELSIVVYDLTTRRFTKIYSGGFWDKPRWGSKDWIVFNRQGQLFKLKSNGDSLTQLTFANKNHHPCWNPEGDKIACMSWIRNGNDEKQYVAILDAGGQISGAIENSVWGAFNGAWGDQNLLCSGGAGKGLAFRRYPDLELIKLIENISSDYIISLDFIPNTSKVVWTSSKGVFITDYDSQTTTTLKSSCETKQYTSISVAPDGKKILSTVLHYVKNRKEKQVDVFVRVLLMNMDGTDEEEIVFSK